MPWMIAFAGTSLRIILEEGFREAAVGDDGRTFSESTIITKTILGDEIIIRTEQIAFVQHMTVEDWEKLVKEREKAGSRLTSDPPLIDPLRFTGVRFPGR